MSAAQHNQLSHYSHGRKKMITERCTVHVRSIVRWAAEREIGRRAEFRLLFNDGFISTVLITNYKGNFG